MKRRIKRTFVGFVGGFVVLVGIILIPYPGPGWLTVFAGLSILATEYDFAKRALAYTKSKYDAWVDWTQRQHPWVRLLLGLGTAFVVFGTMWIINGLGAINHFFNLGWDWLDSPLPIFHQ